MVWRTGTRIRRKGKAEHRRDTPGYEEGWRVFVPPQIFDHPVIYFKMLCHAIQESCLSGNVCAPRLRSCCLPLTWALQAHLIRRSGETSSSGLADRCIPRERHRREPAPVPFVAAGLAQVNPPRRIRRHPPRRLPAASYSWVPASRLLSRAGDTSLDSALTVPLSGEDTSASVESVAGDF